MLLYFVILFVCLKFYKLSYLVGQTATQGPESRQDSPLSPAKEHLAKNSLFFSSFVFGHSGTRRLWQCLCAIRKHWEAFSAGFMELDA